MSCPCHIGVTVRLVGPRANGRKTPASALKIKGRLTADSLWFCERFDFLIVFRVLEEPQRLRSTLSPKPRRYSPWIAWASQKALASSKADILPRVSPSCLALLFCTFAVAFSILADIPLGACLQCAARVSYAEVGPSLRFQNVSPRSGMIHRQSGLCLFSLCAGSSMPGRAVALLTAPR